MNPACKSCEHRRYIPKGSRLFGFHLCVKYLIAITEVYYCDERNKNKKIKEE